MNIVSFIVLDADKTEQKDRFHSQTAMSNLANPLICLCFPFSTREIFCLIEISYRESITEHDRRTIPNRNYLDKTIRNSYKQIIIVNFLVIFKTSKNVKLVLNSNGQQFFSLQKFGFDSNQLLRDFTIYVVYKSCKSHHLTPHSGTVFWEGLCDVIW